ncbi:pectate lyase [Chitinophaga horti]|uniref:Pectate lyase n=1 Tax=Chitinophaga horti TaxID=2920382 RepID=A0ABY6J5H4_9BACT|nr:pectate lyase [Chitinophaga horti]UYQ94872.1 pectate lyase [Chitinophaga horti]
MRLRHLTLVLGCYFLPAALYAQPPAFPGAEGFGKHTTGGRGGAVYTVTNLADDGPGSLREALNKKGARTIVFAVSGTVALESTLEIKQGDVTLAGQSAPGDGICIRNYPVEIEADNVIVRYLRFRMGDVAKKEGDAFGGRNRRQIMIDHCSISWGTDECASFYRNREFTMQWCIIAESLNHSVHVKGDHGYGGIWGGEGASFHHNLLASHKSRMPRFSGSASTQNPEDELVDFRNNVVFNWGINSSYGGERGRYNVVNNYYRPGPATQSRRKACIVNPSAPYGQFYVNGNVMHGNAVVTKNNWNGGVDCEQPDSARALKAFTVANIPVETAEKAYERVLACAGASLRRDAADKRIVADVRSGQPTTGKNGLIDTQADVAGWPELGAATALTDTDGDGMPDNWERKHGLDPNNAEDGKGVKLDKVYTNLEVYLNGLVK